MLNNAYFYGQHKNEKLELYGYKHWFFLLKRAFGLIVLFITTIILFSIWVFVEKLKEESFFQFLSNHEALSLIFCAWFLFLTHVLFIQIFDYFFDFIIVTDMRFIEVRKGVFFKNDIETLDLVKIQDAQSHSNGVFESIFDFGALHLTLSSIHDPKIIPYVPHPVKFIEFINTLKRRILFKHEQFDELSLHRHTEDQDISEEIVI